MNGVTAADTLARGAEFNRNVTEEEPMADERLLRELLVFVASPSDVADARDAARRAVLRIDRLVSRDLGITIVPRGWENVPVGMADRAQEVINAEVDRAHAFIGILHVRFGSDTGLVESGTLEEYERIVSRRGIEEPPPEVMMYFRPPPPDLAGAPDEQLARVLEFKNEIGTKGVYHKDFQSNEKLEEEIEEALATWVRKRAQDSRIEDTLSETSKTDLTPPDLELLGSILQGMQVEDESSLSRLRAAGLVQEGSEASPTSSTDGFLRLASRMLRSSNKAQLLDSDYYRAMLDENLGALVATRFHCGSDPEFVAAIVKLAKLSPSAAEYLLFGDTRLFDNLAEHARTLGGQRQSEAREMAVQNLLHRALLRYAQDSINSDLLDHVDERPVIGQLIAIRIAAAHKVGREFDVMSTMPTVRVPTQGTIEQGQLVSGPPSITIQSGLSLLHMGELDWAIKEFDKVIGLESAPPNAKAAALNNKALVLLQQGNRDESIRLLKTALELTPGLEQAEINLKLATAEESETKGT